MSTSPGISHPPGALCILRVLRVSAVASVWLRLCGAVGSFLPSLAHIILPLFVIGNLPIRLIPVTFPDEISAVWPHGTFDAHPLLWRDALPVQVAGRPAQRNPTRK